MNYNDNNQNNHLQFHLGSIKISKALIVIFIVSLCFQNVSIISFGGVSLKLYHLLSLIFLPGLFNKNAYNEMNKVVLFFTGIFIISLVSGLRYGFTSFIINYIFCIYIIFVFNSFMKKYTVDEIIEMMKIACWFVLIAIVFNLLCQINQIIYFFHNLSMGHPIVSTIFGGGINLDATWIAILGAVFINSRKKVFILYWGICFLISFLFMSRAGLIADAFLIFIFIHYRYKRKVKMILIFCLLIIVVCLASFTSMGRAVFLRFVSIGKPSELGSLGRLNMWKYVYPAFKKNPFGYGAGNALKILESISGEKFNDGNVHNLYFQFLLDFGFIYFIILFILFFIYLKKVILKEGFFSVCIFLYLVLAFIQFRGADAIIAFLFVCYLKESDSKERRLIYDKKSISYNNTL